jgi:hypothetical protein
MAEGDAARKNLWLGMLMGAVVVTAALGLCYLYAQSKPEEPPLCNACRRPIQEDTAFSVVVGGHEVHYCCPRCWVTSLRVQDGKDQRPTATDYTSRRRLPADQCVYVEGSNLMPCCGPNMTRGKDGVPAVECYDRCFPSTIAFASPEEALQFSKEHGGTIVPYQTLTDEAKKP